MKPLFAPASAPAFPILLLSLFAIYFWLFRRYAGVSLKNSYLALGACLLVALAVVYQQLDLLEKWGNSGLGVRRGEALFGIICAAVAIGLLGAFILKLWGRWVGDRATAEERLPGLPGVRAWFSTANVIVGAGLVGTLWYGFDISPLFSTIVIAAALAAAPLLRMENSREAKPSAVVEDLSPEREKILSMLEAGKLTAEESTELIQALQQPTPATPRQAPLTSSQRLILIGAAVVGLGFFMPWLVINPGKEAGRMMEQMQGSMNSTFGAEMNFPGAVGFSGNGINTPTVSISGGDIQRGLGWVALGMALTAALLPYLAVNLDAATARTIRMLCLGVGGFIILYLITSNLRFVGIGLIMALCGYILESIGIFRETAKSNQIS